MRVHRCAYLNLQVTTGGKDFHSYEMGLGTRAVEDTEGGESDGGHARLPRRQLRPPS